jgi:hypothetical protein
MLSDAGPSDTLTFSVIDDPTGEVLADLRTWLRDDIRGLYVEQIHRPLTPEEMSSGVLAALETAVVSKELFATVVTAVGGWLSARAMTRRTKIRVRRGEYEVEIDTADLDKADDIVRRLASDLGDE